MITLTRQDVLNILQAEWATYVKQFRCLSPEAQTTFIAEQGFARFADLLAHIVAWWEIGHHSIEKFCIDPKFQPEEYDVDAVNAEAVAKAEGLNENSVVESFEKMRGFLYEYVKALPDNAFENEKVINQINMELIDHLSDHDIPISQNIL